MRPIYQHQQILCCNICLKLGYPQIWWLRWISCSPFKLQLWGMGYTGIPTFRHIQTRLGQLLLDAEGVQLGRRGVLSPAMGPLDKSTCCVFSGNCLKNVGRSTSSEQPGLLISSPTKLGGLIIICPSIGCLKAVRAGLQSTNWGTSSNQNDIGIHWRYLQCTTWKFSWSQFKRTVAADRRTPNFRPCCWVTTKPGQISSGCHWIALDGGS